MSELVDALTFLSSVANEDVRLYKPVIRLEWYDHDSIGTATVVDRKGHGPEVGHSSSVGYPGPVTGLAQAARELALKISQAP